MAPGRDSKRKYSDISSNDAESAEYHGVRASEIDTRACGSVQAWAPEDGVSDGGRTVQFGAFKDILWKTCERFDFCGSFFFTMMDELANGRHPALTMKGVGPVELPLTKYTAERIMSAATKSSGGSWEVKPANVHFMNTRWKEMVDDYALHTVCERLGVSVHPSQQVHCQFEKLLLFRPDTRPIYTNGPPPKESGIFANLLVILPSAFGGGRITLIHQGLSRSIDVSANANTSLCFVAWHAHGVTQEVRHIESAHQLALSFTLRVVHTPNEAPHPHWPIPSLPDMTSEVTVIRNMLLKWADDECEGMPSVSLMALFLKKHYPEAAERGIKSLQGPDAHLAGYLLPVAQDLGFTVCLANLTLTVTGYRKGYLARLKPGQKKNLPDIDPINEDTPMEEAHWEEYELSDLFRIGGTKRKVTSYLPTIMDISGEAIAPDRPFDGRKPAERNVIDVAWGEPVLEHKYHGTVLALYRTTDEISLSVSAQGLDWALRQLPTKPDDRPASDIEKFELAILANLGEFRSRTYKSEKEKEANLKYVIEFIGYALMQEHSELWNALFPHLVSANPTVLESIIDEALGVFDFASIRAGIDEFIKITSDTTVRTRVMRTVLLCSKKKQRTLPLHYRFYISKETTKASLKKVHFEEPFELLNSVKEKKERSPQRTSKFLFGESGRKSSAPSGSSAPPANRMKDEQGKGEASTPSKPFTMKIESLLVSTADSDSKPWC